MTASPEAERSAHSRRDLEDGRDRAEAWHDLILAMHLLDTALERQTQRDGGISHGHFKILVLLSAADGRRLGLKALADNLRFSQSRISHALTALERDGLVTRSPTSGGRRASEAILTNEGRLLVGRVLRAQREEIRDPLFDDLSESATVALGEVSSRIIETLSGTGALDQGAASITT